MYKMLLLVAGILLAITGVSHATSIDEEGYRKCLTSSGEVMVVPEKRLQLSAVCRLMLSPPRFRDDWNRQTRKAVAPFMPFHYGSNGKRAVAISCVNEHGKTIDEATWRRLQKKQPHCPLFYYPVIDGDVYTVIIPAADPGDGTARGHLY